MDTDANGLEALVAIEARLGRLEERSDLALPSKEDLCKEYLQIREHMEDVLFIVGKIPAVGARIVKTLRFVMQVADAVCSEQHAHNT